MAFRKEDYPNLNDTNHRITSPDDVGYNCIAHALGKNDQWWEPAEGYQWPPPEIAPHDYKLTSLIEVYRSEGFDLCANPSQEPGFDKIALYADEYEYTHAAVMLENGKWSSKLGQGQDIEHETLDVVEGPNYGRAVKFMKRACRLT
jgi:hypothetical protein